MQEFPGSRVHAGLSLCPSVVVQVKTACPDSLKTTESQATDQAEQQQQSRQWLRTAGSNATNECGEVNLWGRARVKLFFARPHLANMFFVKYVYINTLYININIFGAFSFSLCYYFEVLCIFLLLRSSKFHWVFDFHVFFHCWVSTSTTNIQF